MFPYRRLSVWRKAHALVLQVYQVTDDSVIRRDRALTSQLRRSAASIAANIAEGSSYDSQPQFGRFLGMALASARESEYHLLVARDVGLLGTREYAGLEARVTELQQMLAALRRKVVREVGSKEKRGAQ